jgi:hypothetical protein
MKTAALCLFSFGMICRGQSIMPLSENESLPLVRPHAIQLQSLEWVVPELIIGGEWTSSIRLTNRGSSAIPTTNVYFIDNNGQPMQTTFIGTDGLSHSGPGFSFSLGTGGIVEAAFSGTPNAAFGHAIIGCSALGCGTHGLYGEVTLRNHNATRPDFVVVFPLEEPAALQYMLFDGRSTPNGVITTTLYLVNENVTSSTVTIDVRDVNNNLTATTSIAFTPQSTQILSLHALLPQTIGIEGTLVIRSSSASSLITATALRIDPSNSFAPQRAFVPAP